MDGLRVLVKLEGHFHPGKIQAISPPDIYGVLVDKERGNKPHIFSREEVLQEAVRTLPFTFRTFSCVRLKIRYHADLKKCESLTAITTFKVFVAILISSTYM